MRKEKWCRSARLIVSLFGRVCVGAQTRGLTCTPPPSSVFSLQLQDFVLLSHISLTSLLILIPRTLCSRSLTDFTPSITPASLLKLGAPVITTPSSIQRLNTPQSHTHLAFHIPLSSCPSVPWHIQHKLHEYCRGGVMLGMPSLSLCVIGWRGGLMTHGACCD